MTPEEYYRIKADVENELNNEIFGVQVQKTVIQDARDSLMNVKDEWFVERYYEGFGIPKWHWKAENTFIVCHYYTQVQRIDEAFDALSPEDQVMIKLRGDAPV